MADQPSRALVPVSDDQRESALAILRDAVASDDLSLEAFSSTATAIVEARSADELSSIVRQFAPVVRMTPPDRRMNEPLELQMASGTLTLNDSWQVPRETRVSCRSGRMLLDLTKAEFDDDLVDMDLRCTSGTIEIVVPHAVDVQFVKMSVGSGRISNELTAGSPFAPAVRIRMTAETTSGRITVRRPSPPKQKSRRWFRRSRPAS